MISNSLNISNDHHWGRLQSVLSHLCPSLATPHSLSLLAAGMAEVEVLFTPRKAANIARQSWLQTCRSTPLPRVKLEREWKRFLWGKIQQCFHSAQHQHFTKWVKPCGLLPETFQLLLTGSKHLIGSLRLPVSPEPLGFSFLIPTSLKALVSRHLASSQLLWNT